MTRQLLNSVQTAEYLGVKRSYLGKLMMRKAIPYYKPNGKLCFFDPKDLDNWLRHIRIASADEVQTMAAGSDVQDHFNK